MKPPTSSGSARGHTPSPISVVICTRDRPEHLGACLRAVLAQDHPCFEVIVVDSAPRDDRVASIAARFPVRYLVEERPGLSRARNLGAAMASYPLIAFTDDDTRPDPGWLRALAIGFEDPEVMAVTGLVLPFVLETPAQALFEQACGGMAKGTEPRLFRRDQLSMMQLIATHHMGVGANMAFRRETFARVGLFDPWLGADAPGRAAEDLDMFHRVVAGGLALFYEPMAVVRHRHPRGMSELERHLANSGCGFANYLRKLRRTRTVRRGYVIVSAARRCAELLWGALGLSAVPTQLMRAQLRGLLKAWKGIELPAAGAPAFERTGGSVHAHPAHHSTGGVG